MSLPSSAVPPKSDEEETVPQTASNVAASLQSMLLEFQNKRRDCLHVSHDLYLRWCEENSARSQKCESGSVSKNLQGASCSATSTTVSATLFDSPCRNTFGERLTLCSPLPGSSLAAFHLLTPEEQEQLLTHYEQELTAMCVKWDSNPLVLYAAQSYFKKFYLKYSVMDYHPNEIRLVAAWVAQKGYGCHEEAKTADCLDYDSTSTIREIVDMERLLLTALEFKLSVSNPFLQLRILTESLKEAFPSVEWEAQHLLAKELLLHHASSDFILFVPNCVLAYAAAHNVCTRYFPQALIHVEHQMAGLQQQDNDLTHVVSKELSSHRVKAPSSKTAKKLVDKLNQCANPALAQLEAEHLQKEKEETERAKEQKRKEKKEKQRQQDEALFGTCSGESGDFVIKYNFDICKRRRQES